MSVSPLEYKSQVGRILPVLLTDRDFGKCLLEMGLTTLRVCAGGDEGRWALSLAYKSSSTVCL